MGLTTTFLLLLFSHSRLPSHRWRPVAWLAVLGIALGAATLAILPWDLLDLPVENPLGVEGVRNAEVVLGLCAGGCGR